MTRRLTTMALTFYHVTWCPECLAVRSKLDALKVPYEAIRVPDARMFRREVFAVSGQSYVPVIKDGDLVLTETNDILSYLDDCYGTGARPEARSRWAEKAAKRAPAPPSLGEDDEYPSCRL
jgi:glutathione S-transferase